jgi:hypothetical protein
LFIIKLGKVANIDHELEELIELKDSLIAKIIEEAVD